MHIPVLLDEVLQALQLKKDGIYVDGTVGYGGHTEEIAKSSLKVIGIDRDQDALDSAAKRLSKLKNVDLEKGSYAEIDEILAEKEIELVDGILLDLGASSPQFDSPERGFSFKEDGPLDMRFDVSSQKTAADILNTYQESALADILKNYGEERNAKKIARKIVAARKEQQFTKTSQLVQLIEAAIPRRFWPKNIHPATRTFQALRIEVNEELEELKAALEKFTALLKPGGRLVIISFHSLEDRIVKQFFKEATKDCVCPREFPVCRCETVPTLKIITKKPVQATKIETNKNVRSRSAKMRVAERL